jgi:hypothetical protein
MHKTGNRIYHLWSNLIRIIQKISLVLLPELSKSY